MKNPKGVRNMDCSKYRQFACEPDTTSLPKATIDAMKEHAHLCAPCQDYAAQIREIEQGLKCLALVKAPADFTRTLVKCLPATGQGSTAWSLWRMVGVAAIILLFFGFPTYMLLEHPQTFVESNDVRAAVRIVGQNVIVPEDVVVKGDLRVYHASLRVLGRVDGNVYLVSSEHSLGESGRVRGQIVRLTHLPWDKVVFGFRNISQELRSYLRGAWR